MLNVSEFKDATTASEALISTMQAFGYAADQSQHVVDVLNEVGNNYAVSSDGIATALQDSASALMEGGNNLEQATALVAAANRVVQDPSSVGSALRTISLRLRGTSVEILESIGEETDGVVESTSKLQEKIQALSGVNILTEAGDYKDTYTILREIGNVWEDMSDIDQAALLELMAGKNRANTLSAILSNMEDLTGAYESALNAEGSALRENEAYLNSIEGRIALFNNAVQTMWMNFMDDEIIKFIVDVGTHIVELADQIGLLPSAISGWTGFSTFKNNFKVNLEEMQKELEKTMQQQDFNVSSDLGSQMLQIEAEDLNDAVDAQKSYNTAARDGADANRDLAGALGQQNQQMKEVGTSTKTTATFTTKASAAIKTLGQSLKAMAMSWIVTFVVQEAITILYNVAHATENAIQAANDALDEYNNSQDELKKKKKTVDELGDAYKRLSNGVNTLTNENIGLTVEAHQEYLNVCNDLAEIFPELVTGYDAQGNAIINLTDDVHGLTDAYREAEKAAAAELLYDTKNKKNIWTKYETTAGATYRTNDLDKSITLSDQQTMLKALLAMDEDTLSALYKADESGLYKQFEILQEHLKTMGVNWDTSWISAVFNNLQLNEQADNFNEYRALINSTLTEVNKDIATGMSGIRTAISANLVFDDFYQNLDESSKGLVNTLVKNLDPEMIKQSGAKSLDDLLTWFSEEIPSQVSKENITLYENITDTSNDLAKAMADGDEGAYRAAASEWADLISDEWRDASGNIAIDPDADFITQYLQKLAQDIENKSKNYEVRLQMKMDFDAKDSLGELLVAYTGDDRATIEGAIKGLNIPNSPTLSGVKIDDIYKGITTALDGEDDVLRTDEFEDLYNKFLNNDMSDWSQDQINAIHAVDAMLKIYGIDLATLTDMMMEFGYVQQSLSDIPSFNLASESTNEAIDEFQKNIETVKEAWNSLNNREMTKSEFLDLCQEFPELMDGVNLSDDNWMVKAQENLEKLNETNIKDYLENLELMKEAMTARGEDPANIKILENYIEYVKQIQNQPLLIPKVQSDTLAGLTEVYDTYKTILTESNEILYDGQKVSEGYYESLKDYIDDVDALNECFDENNKQIVTNSKQLKKLISEQKKATAQTVRESKAQARLKYLDLYKEMRRLVDGSDSLSSATVNHINSLYDEMGVIQSAIAQYSMLESQLLGTTSAYEQLEQAQTLDAETDYGSKAEEMVNVLANAFNTSELGTASAQAAIAGLIPDDIIDKSKALDEQMESIYKYFTNGEVSKLFTIEFDDDGGISSVEMTKENVEAFTKSLIGNAEEGAVFQGTWDEFTLNPAITSLKQFADELKVTEEVAFAYLTELEKYDINWLGGNYETLLDQLMGDDVSYGIQKATQELAKLTKEKAALLEGGIDDSEKQRLAEINAEIETLNGKLDDHKVKALDAWQAYSEIDTALANTDNLQKKVSDVFSEDIIANVGLTGEETVKEAYDKLLAYQLKLGEPTELILQFASEQAEKELAALEDKLNKSGIEVDGKVALNADTGEWTYTGDTNGLTDAQKADLQSYLNTYGDLQTINTTLATGVSNVESYAQRTADAVESIDGKITGDGNNDTGNDSESDEVDTTTGADAPTTSPSENNREKPDVDEEAVRYNLAVAKGRLINWQSSASETGGGHEGIFGPQYIDPATIPGGGIEYNFKTGKIEPKSVAYYDKKNGNIILPADLEDPMDIVETTDNGNSNISNPYGAHHTDLNGREVQLEEKDDGGNAEQSTESKPEYADAVINAGVVNIGENGEITLPNGVKDSLGFVKQIEKDSSNVIDPYGENHTNFNNKSSDTGEVYVDTNEVQITSDDNGSDKTKDDADIDAAAYQQYLADKTKKDPDDYSILDRMLYGNQTDFVLVKTDDENTQTDTPAPPSSNSTEEVKVEAKEVYFGDTGDYTTNPGQAYVDPATYQQYLADKTKKDPDDYPILDRRIYGDQADFVLVGDNDRNLTSIGDLNEELSTTGEQTTEVSSAAYDMWEAYTQNEAALDALAEIKANRDETFMMGQSMGQLLTHDEASMLGIELNVGDILTVQQAYDMLIAKQSELEQPVQLTAEVAIDEIDKQIAELQSAITNNDFSNVDPVSVGLEVGKAPTKEDVEAKLAELKQDKAVISTIFGIELSEEDRLELETELSNIEKLTIGNKEFWVLSNGADATLKVLGEVQKYDIDDKSVEIKTTYTTEYKTIGSTGTVRSGAGGGGRYIKSTAINVNGTAHVDGSAYKGGSWGAPKTETALTGELGPELRVRGNRWDLLGENGAEFSDIRKGDIMK